MMDDEDLGIVFPRCAVPGTLAIASSGRNVGRVQQMQSAASREIYRIEAVVGSHIPLTGSLAELVRLAPETGLSVNEPPLSIYLHHGGRDAVFLDLNARPDGTLASIGLDVDADSPFAAFAGARSAANELLDVLVRSLWLPLVLVRLDLHVNGEPHPIAHQLHVPFVGGLSMGPLGGVHQYPLFSELESLAREAICSTSPHYRLLCAHRLYEGIGALRGKLRKLCVELSVDAPMPKDSKVDPELLAAMGLGGLADQSVRSVGDLHGKLTDLRDRVAHFLLTKGGGASPLHTSDGYRTKSIPAQLRRCCTTASLPSRSYRPSFVSIWVVGCPSARCCRCCSTGRNIEWWCDRNRRQ